MENLPNLTYAQKLRLKWLSSITPEDDSNIAAELLPQTDGSFEMSTLALISDFCTVNEGTAIFDRYLEMFNAVLSANDIVELGNLLSLPIGTIRPLCVQNSLRLQTKPPQ